MHTEISPRRLGAFALDLLYPNRCDCCGRFIRYDAALCTRCIAELDALRVSAADWDCPAAETPLFDGLVTLFSYESTAKNGVLALKNGHRGFCRYVAPLLADAVRDIIDPAEIACITWVPTARTRRRTQGYAHAELLGKAVAAELHCKTRGDLLVEFPTKIRQHQLSAKDRAVFADLRLGHTGADICGQTVLIIDDILTTGSTLRRCTALLREMGAARVIAAAAACRRRG